MTHHCRTGFHTTPHYSCYSAHGCRCDGCRAAKVERNRTDRHRQPNPHALARVTVDLPRRPWELVTRELQRRGVTPDEWLHALAQKVKA